MEHTGELCLEHHMFVLDAHLLAELGDDDGERIARGLVDELIETLGMQPLAPLSVHPATDRRAPGWSFVQPITTSHISGHYFAKPGPRPHMHLDIYTCSPLSQEQIVPILHAHLGLADWVGTFIVRDMQLHHRRVIGLAGVGAAVHTAIPLEAESGIPPVFDVLTVR